ncbi:hypothetical protein M3Y96_01088400 [Aphelenchoides besseyi]|nr:hypothetical protein M3Y96_01088400 [Aphelenchoides besseyi]
MQRFVFWFATISTVILILQIDPTATSPIRCKCQECGNTTAIASNNSTDETAMLIAMMFDFDDDNSTTPTVDRFKRESLYQRRPCDSRFQIELLLIPLSILFIPISICCFLLANCYCGPKDTRAKVIRKVEIPEQMFGFRIQPTPRRRNDTVSSLNFGDGFVQRKRSQKTKFNTKVLVIERRRESAITTSSASPDLNKNAEKRTQFATNITILNQGRRSSKIREL